MANKTPPKVELTIPIIHDMELAATNTAEVVAKHMQLSEEKTAEISMALIEAPINAFEHSQTETSNVEIHFIIEGDMLVIKVTDQGQGFDKSKVEIPNIEKSTSSIKVYTEPFCPETILPLFRIGIKSVSGPLIEVAAGTKI